MEIEELHKQSQQLRNQGQHENAEEVLRKALAIDSENGSTWMLLAAALDAQGKQKETQEAFKNAVKYDPVGTYFTVATNMHKQGRLKEALEAYAVVMKHDSKHDLAWTRVGAAFAGLGLMSEAESNLRHAIELNPNNVEARNNLGAVLQKQGKLSEAEESIRSSLSIDSENCATWINLGALLIEKGEFIEATKACKKGVELNAEYANGWYMLSLAHARSKEYTEAGNASLKSVELNPRNILYLERHGDNCINLEKFDSAYDMYGRITKIDPSYHKAYYYQAYVVQLMESLDSDERTKLAITYLKKATELEPKNGLYWHNLGVIYKVYGKEKDAKKAFKQARKLNVKLREDGASWIFE